MKIKFSHKDLLLLIGVLVAAVIALSTWMNSDNQSKNGVARPQIKKEALNSTTSMVIDKLIGKVVKPHSSLTRN